MMKKMMMECVVKHSRRKNGQGGGGGGIIKARAAGSLPPPPLLWAVGPYKGAPSSPEKGVGAPLGGSSFPTPYKPWRGEERGGSPPFLLLDGGRTGGRWPSGQPLEAPRRSPRRRPEGRRGLSPPRLQHGGARASPLSGQLARNAATYAGGSKKPQKRVQGLTPRGMSCRLLPRRSMETRESGNVTLYMTPWAKTLVASSVASEPEK
ncbi:hypothetical protein Sjap_015772 [Stephania japonica]|uniref:Uncharacterized protein n=1 Tax=Stephania japonica TaxID=461633 RepID=A0AAP0IK86_9MAGN